MFMNNYDYDILKTIRINSVVNQRDLSNATGYSLGTVNKSVKNLMDNGFLTSEMALTSKARFLINERKPKNAIILAAGYGMRMVPINTETPKALLEVNGETLIERQIKQLHEKGINKIYVVVGFMKEKLEYLIDDYGVELIVNPEYGIKNNLVSLFLANKYIDNAYVIPSDIYFKDNPFDDIELYSWYMVIDNEDADSDVRVNRKKELIRTNKKSIGNSMIGLSYLCSEEASSVRQKLKEYSSDQSYDDSFWEETLFVKGKMITKARVVSSSFAAEINTYEQLRELDSKSEQLKSKTIQVIKDALNATSNDIVDIKVLKKGMTNRSFLFSCRGKKYIMRIPGEGTDMLINREEEAAVYDIIKDKNICDNLIYINPKNGYKITEYFNESRNCNSEDFDEVRECMAVLRKFHDMKLKVNHTFDIFKQILFYESLWNGAPSVFKDYNETKEKVFELKEYIDKHAKEYSLTHIDAVCDNFLFVRIDGKEQIRLIDWEYAGMQDTDVDLAMNCIYALYDRKQVEKLINAYYVEGCSKETRIKIYCYIAACGLLWSNWCEYKRALGVEFGEYALRQYRYAKDYYRIVKEELNND